MCGKAVEKPEEQVKGNEETQETEEKAAEKPEDELKIVVIMKGNKIMLGVQAPDCDPVYETLEGELPAALKRLPKLVAEANEKWTTNPRNPKANLPEPVKEATPARTPATPTKKPAQPSFF